MGGEQEPLPAGLACWFLQRPNGNEISVAYLADILGNKSAGSTSGAFQSDFGLTKTGDSQNMESYQSCSTRITFVRFA